MSRSVLYWTVVLALSRAAVAQGDPFGFVYNLSNLHTYPLSPAGTNWQSGQAYARSLGGYLVAINDGVEQAFINVYAGWVDSFWIGLSDAAVEGQFRWDSGEPSNYTNWCSGEPNNLGNNEDYVGAVLGPGGFCWNDISSPYSGPNHAPANALIELPYGHRVNFDLPSTSECVTPFPSPLGGATDPEGVSWNGAGGFSGSPFVTSAPDDGMPVTGTKYLRMPGSGVLQVPVGGPLQRPVPPGINEVRVAIPPGTKGVSFAWDYLSHTSALSGIDDGADISVVDGQGARIGTVLVYADGGSTVVPSMTAGHCIPFGGSHLAPVGPKAASIILPPLPYPAYLSIVCWKGSSTLSRGFIHVDAIQFWDAGPFQLDITAPSGPGSIRIQNTGGSPGNQYWTAATLTPGSFPFGWLFGLDIPVADLLTQVTSGPPFSGTLNGIGSSSFTVSSGIPPGLQVYAVSLQFQNLGTLGGPFVNASPLEHFVTP